MACLLSAGDYSQFRRADKESRNILAPDEANMKLPRPSDAIRPVNYFRFGNRNEFVQHSVNPKIARSSLVDQLSDSRANNQQSRGDQQR